MTKSMNCALIGYGYWGKIVERYLKEEKKLFLKYIYDVSLDNGITLSVIEDDATVRVIFVCTPISSHYDIVRLFLNKGKHVFCEKPLAKSVVEARELVELAKKREVCLYTDYIYTVSPSINYLKDYLGRLGNILTVDGEIQQFGNFYRNDSVQEVLGVHMISAIAYMFGLNCGLEIQENFNIRKDSKGNILECESLLSCSKAKRIRIHCNLTSESKIRRLRIEGEHGNLLFDMLGESTAQVLLMRKSERGYVKIHEESKRFDEGNNLKMVIADFLYNINNGHSGNTHLSILVTDLTERLQTINKE